MLRWVMASAAAVRQRLGRPKGIVESTRWLFGALAVVAVLLSLPGPLTGDHGEMRAVGLAAALILIVSWAFGYLTRHVPLGLDVLDAVAITAFSLACPDPLAVLGIAFSAVWFRGLYGSTGRSLTRCLMYMSALCASLLFWERIPGHDVAPAIGSVVGSFPILLLTVIVARQLASGLQVRDESLRRNAVLANTGSRLLGVLEYASIRAAAWTGLTEICAVTGQMHILKLTRDGDLLRVDMATSGFRAVPATMPGEVIASDAGRADAHVVDKSPLDEAFGASLAWTCVSLTDEKQDAWLVVGEPKKSPADALLAVRTVVNQTTLALRNSDVHQELTVQARVDSLTGLANRAAFTEELSTCLARQPRPDAVHVMFLDLDDFKDVNDILGHRAGDELLTEVAERLRRCTRPNDVCARLGGDEFAVVLFGATDEVAMGIGLRMVESIAEPVRLGSRTARVGVSIGLASETPGVAAEELLHEADVAMYAAKASGKGCVQPFTTGLLQADRSRLSFERQLATAIEAGELVVHYQPVLSLPDLRCIAVEARVRWQHPQRGLLLLREFREIAERTGAIVDIGAFVLRRACADATAWQLAHPAARLPVHVNILATQLDDEGFIDVVEQCLSESGMPANRLILEFSETVVLNSPAAIVRLKAVAALGVRIGIDDFGTGYSSLTTLRSLPVNVIKLDRTFVAGALDNPIDRAVITAIVRMSSQLGLLTIAEGVERHAQQEFLQEIGTDAVQGRLYSGSVPAAQLTIWLDTNLIDASTTENEFLSITPAPNRVSLSATASRMH